MHDDASITPSFVIHSHLLDGIAASVAAYRLSFPLQTHVRQTHAWGWCFYSTTWRVRLSLTGTLSCQGSMTLPLSLRTLRYNFERTGRTHRVHSDKCGHSPTLSGKRPQEADSASGGIVCQIPRLPVTQTVRRLTEAVVKMNVAHNEAFK